MKLAQVVETSARVARTPSRLAKLEELASCLRAARPEQVGIAVRYLSGAVRQRRLGIGGGGLGRARQSAVPAHDAMLTLADVDCTLERIALLSGVRSGAERTRLLGELFTRATGDEQDFLARLLVGELRQGARGVDGRGRRDGDGGRGR